MKLMPQDDSVTAGPFKFGEKQEFRPTHKLEDVEPNHVPVVSKGTSTLKTIANGLNALSGPTLNIHFAPQRART